MEKLCCIIYATYRTFENPEKALALSIICSKYKNENEKKKNNGDINNSWFNWKYIITLKIWSEENIIQDIGLKNVDERKVESTKRFVQLWIILNTFLFQLLQLLTD